MPNLQIGRVGLDVATKHPSRITDRGNAVTIDAKLHGQDEARTHALMHQLAGYVANPDERRVPVLMDFHDQWDGFYEVLDVNIDVSRDGWFSRLIPFTLAARPVSLPRTPQMVSRMSGGLRANDHGIVVAGVEAWHGLPTTIAQYGFSVVGTPLYYQRVGVGGTINLHGYGASNDLFDAAVPWRIQPANFYDMAATILDRDSRAVVGRRTTLTPTAWTLSNGLVKLDGTANGFDIATYDVSAATWGTATEIRFGHNDSGWFASTVVAVEISRNAPEEVAIHLACEGGLSMVDVSIWLRRGARIARCVLTGDTDRTWGVKSMDTGANWTDGTSHAYRASADADGNVLCAFTSKANDISAANRTMVLTTAGPQIDVGVGYEVAGGDTTIDQRLDLRDQYFARQSEVAEVALS
jgi:hypothetical protein